MRTRPGIFLHDEGVLLEYEGALVRKYTPEGARRIRYLYRAYKRGGRAVLEFGSPEGLDEFLASARDVGVPGTILRVSKVYHLCPTQRFLIPETAEDRWVRTRIEQVAFPCYETRSLILTQRDYARLKEDAELGMWNLSDYMG